VSTRALTSVVAIALLTLVTVLVAGTVAGGLLGMEPPAESPPQVSLDASANASADRIALTHAGGDVVQVSRLRVRITVGDERLARQPPVPFFAARGFHAGPTGPFNVASDPEWGAGETAAVTLAGTNSPQLSEGVRVRVELFRGEYRIGSVTVRAA